MSFAVCRMEKMKAHDLKGIQFHNQRERDSKTNLDIDKERSKENYDLVNQGKINYNERVKEIIESQKTGTRKTRKDAVLVNEFILTSDKPFFDSLDGQEQRKFFEESFHFFADRYGKQNIAYATVHMDEHTPHMHLGVVPMRDGKLQGKNVFNRKELMWLQEEYPKHLRNKGFELERGEKGSDREHVETQKFKKQMVEKELEELKKQVADKERELAEKKREWQAFNESVPVDVNVRVKRERKTIEVESKEKNLFGLPKKETKQVPTGNVIIPEDDYKKLKSAAKDNKQLKGMVERVLQIDFVQENQRLKAERQALLQELQAEKKARESLRKEYTKLFWENDSLKDQVKNLKKDIKIAYTSIKEFLKERTEGFRSYQKAFSSLIDKIHQRTVKEAEKGAYEPKKNIIVQEHEKNIRKQHEMER